jgi:hypothetical protein
VDPRIVRRAVKGLVAKRVIRQLDGHFYSYVKDWDQWVRDGGEGDGPALIGDGERRFIGLMIAQFGIANPSKDKRKVGTNQSPTTDVKGTIQSPPTSVKGTIESPSTDVKGTGWSPMSSDASSAAPGENKDLGIPSSEVPVPPDPLRFREKRDKKDRFLTESHINSREDRGEEVLEPFLVEGIAEPVGPRPEVDPSRQTEAQRVARLAVDRVTRAYPGDESLAEVVSIRVESWVRDEGLLGPDIEVALLKTISAGVGPGGLLKYAHKILETPRPPAPGLASNPGAGPAPTQGSFFPARPTKADRNAQEAAERHAMIDSMFPPKEAHHGHR